MKTITMSTVVALMWIVLPAAARCQTAESDTRIQTNMHSLGISAGLSDFHLKDEYVSASIHRGTIFSATACYHYTGEDSRHYIDAAFGTGTLNSNPSQLAAQYYVGSLSYSYTLKFNQAEILKIPTGFFIGGGVSSSFWVGDYERDSAPFPNDVTTGYAVHGLNVVGRGECEPGERQRFALQVSMPVVRLVSRPQYEVINYEDEGVLDAATNPKSEFFWESLVLLVQTEYRWSLGGDFDLQLQYRFGYSACAQPLPFSAYMNNFFMGVLWKL